MAAGNLPTKYGILLYPQFAVLDAYGPIECINTLQSMGYDVDLRIIGASKTTASSHPAGTEGHHAMAQETVINTSLDEALGLDIEVLIVPGGWGSMPVTGWPELKEAGPDRSAEVDFLRKIYPKLRYLFTVCNGSGLAARAGILDGRTVTTNKVLWKHITSQGPKTKWVANARWMVDGNVWTTSGVSAGIDGMVAFVAHHIGDEKADQLCYYMEYVRHRDQFNDPFADKSGAKDVAPTAA